MKEMLAHLDETQEKNGQCEGSQTMKGSDWLAGVVFHDSDLSRL